MVVSNRKRVPVLIFVGVLALAAMGALADGECNLGTIPAPGGPPAPTPDSRITAIQQLPMQGRAPSSSSSYTGELEHCESEGNGGACADYVYSWYGYVTERLNPTYTEPDRETASVIEIDMTVVVPNGYGTPFPTDEWAIGLEDDLYSFGAQVGQYFPAPGCSPNWFIGDSGLVVRGCVAFGANGLGAYGGMSGRFKPVFGGPPDYPPPACAVLNIPTCLFDFNPSWHHRLM